MENVLEISNTSSYPRDNFYNGRLCFGNEEQMRRLALNHEIASHSYYHSSYKEEDLVTSKLVLEKVTGAPVSGLRMPRMKEVSIEAVSKQGMPTILPLTPL
jgi:peptidoglycan/xylan/chitin deacetylase (PgdA/CDA1 family)